MEANILKVSPPNMIQNVFGLELYCRINITTNLKLSIIFGFSHCPNIQAPSSYYHKHLVKAASQPKNRISSGLSIFSDFLQMFSYVAPTNVFLQVASIKPSDSQKIMPSNKVSSKELLSFKKRQTNKKGKPNPLATG